jgi:hypothetical protein
VALCCVFVHSALVRVEQQLMRRQLELVNTEFVVEGSRGVEVNNLSFPKGKKKQVKSKITAAAARVAAKVVFFFF